MVIHIEGGRTAGDNWLEVADGDLLPPAGDVIVSLRRWLDEREALNARHGRLGLRIRGGEDLAPLAADLGRFALIAVEFPTYSDGRGYSTARLLRLRHGFTGELRAVGDVRRDQVDMMRRCGFDSLVPAAGQDPAALLAALGEVPAHPLQPAGRGE